MSLKKATTIALWMFLGATCVMGVVRVVSPAPAAARLAPQDGVAVYYLHGNMRCVPCMTIEAHAREAVETGFAEDLQAGRIQWHAINYETPGNEQYALDYEVVGPSVVLAKFQGGRPVGWKHLAEVWDHVNDKDAFLDYVQHTLRAFRTNAPAEPPDSTEPPASSVLLPNPE